MTKPTYKTSPEHDFYKINHDWQIITCITHDLQYRRIEWENVAEILTMKTIPLHRYRNRENLFWDSKNVEWEFEGKKYRVKPLDKEAFYKAVFVNTEKLKIVDDTIFWYKGKLYHVKWEMSLGCGMFMLSDIYTQKETITRPKWIKSIELIQN